MPTGFPRPTDALFKPGSNKGQVCLDGIPSRVTDVNYCHMTASFRPICRILGMIPDSTQPDSNGSDPATAGLGLGGWGEVGGRPEPTRPGPTRQDRTQPDLVKPMVGRSGSGWTAGSIGVLTPYRVGGGLWTNPDSRCGLVGEGAIPESQPFSLSGLDSGRKCSGSQVFGLGQVG